MQGSRAFGGWARVGVTTDECLEGYLRRALACCGVHPIGLPSASLSTSNRMGFDDAARGEINSTASVWLQECTEVPWPLYRRVRLGSRQDAARASPLCCPKMRRAIRCDRVGEGEFGLSVRWSFR